MTNYHVVQGQNGGWNVKRDNADRASAHADTQREAEKEAKQFSSHSGGRRSQNTWSGWKNP